MTEIYLKFLPPYFINFYPFCHGPTAFAVLGGPLILISISQKAVFVTQLIGCKTLLFTCGTEIARPWHFHELLSFPA